MPNRIIKESICYSDDIDGLTWFEEVVFYRLIVRCDDNGRLDARPSFLRSMLFATKQNVTERSIRDAVRALASAGLVALYEAEGKPYLMIPKWELHQRVRNVRGKYPPPPGGGTRRAAAKRGEQPPESESGSESQSDPERDRRARFTPPAVEEVSAYCRQRKNAVDPVRFVDFYASKGWRIGREPMRDWKAAVRTWERRGNETGRPEDGAGEASRRVREDVERMRAFLAEQKSEGLLPPP